jgi:SAM-dependent methyltransferase
MRNGYAGTGPGPITPDGSAVELWTRLPVRDEPDVIAAQTRPGGTILELGCGVGRVTRPLAERGFAVTAVDESAAMLERLARLTPAALLRPDTRPTSAREAPGVRTVHSAIEDLDLGERFDVVVLASFLVHAGDTGVRQRMLDACRRHVRPGGRVLVQREGAGWHDEVPREAPLGDDGRLRVVSSEPVGDGVSSVRVEYDFPDASWTQTFRSRPLTPTAFEQALADAGLAVDAYLTEDGTWARARPRPAGTG